MIKPAPEIQLSQYRALAEFRHQIRRFLHFSEQAARRAGLEPQQHQFLLALKGLPTDAVRSVGQVAERLQIQHHSAVELLNRLEERGLAVRERSSVDRREVLIDLTAKGEKLLRALSLHHRAELKSAAPALVRALEALTVDRTAHEARRVACV